jgi:tetratricopeptide (TPR) repeat protein
MAVKFLKFFISLCVCGYIKAAKVPVYDPQVSIWDRIMIQQAQVNMFRGIIYMNHGLYGRASTEFGKAAVQNPQSADAHVLLGASLYWQGQVTNAMTEYKKAIELDNKNAQSYQLLAIAYAWYGKLKSSLENFKTAVELAPKRADIYMDLGSVYYALGNKQKALNHYRKAVQFQPKHPLYHYQLGLLYSRMEKNNDAVNSFREAISLHSGYQDALLELASIYEKTGDFKKSEKYYKKAVKLKPFDAVARFRYANLLVGRMQYEKAAEIIMKAFRLSLVSDKNSIALSTAYGGGENKSNDANDKKPSAEKNSLLENLEKNLNEIGLDQNAQINLKIVYLPPVQFKTGKKETPFTSALQANFSKSSAKKLTRKFLLPAGDKKMRQNYIREIIKEINSISSQIPQNSKTHMSLDIKTDVSEQSEMTDPYSAAGKKVVFNPRNVGNDMGLWIIGTAWLDLVKDIIPSLEEKNQKRKNKGINRLLSGLGNLIIGRPKKAEENFSQAAKSGYSQEGFLGLSAAHIALGNEHSAKQYNEKVLKINPKNKIARENLKQFAKAEKDKK